MNKDFELKGLDALMKNINDQVDQIAGRTQAGLIQAVIFLHHEMETKDPVIPKDTGYLRSSFFMINSNSKNATADTKIDITTGNAQKTKAAKARLSRVNKAILPAVQKRIKGNHLAIVFGFSANYAVYVHENINPDVKWGRPGSGPKFFEAHIKRNKDKVIRIIQNHAKIK